MTINSSYTFGSVEYYKEELWQKQLIADLVKEAVAARIKNNDDKTPLEELCLIVSIINENVYWATKAVKDKEAELARSANNG